MRSRQGAVLDSLERVDKFLGRNAELLAPVVKSTGPQLTDSIGLLTKHAVSQDGGTRAMLGETTNQRQLRLTLRFSHMRPIAALAKLKLRDVPNFSALMMPPSSATAQQLVFAAEAMADTAAPHEAVLVGSGLPSDFIAQLRAAAEAVRASVAGRDEYRGNRSGATAGLGAEERRGRVLLKVLDSLVVPLLGSDDKLLAEWRLAKHIRRLVVTSADGSTVVPTPKPAPTPSTPTPAPVILAPVVQPVVVHPATVPVAAPQ